MGYDYPAVRIKHYASRSEYASIEIRTTLGNVPVIECDSNGRSRFKEKEEQLIVEGHVGEIIMPHRYPLEILCLGIDVRGSLTPPANVIVSGGDVSLWVPEGVRLYAEASKGRLFIDGKKLNHPLGSFERLYEEYVSSIYKVSPNNPLPDSLDVCVGKHIINIRVNGGNVMLFHNKWGEMDNAENTEYSLIENMLAEMPENLRKQLQAAIEENRIDDAIRIMEEFASFEAP